jgi:hypothetical protein
MRLPFRSVKVPLNFVTAGTTMFDEDATVDVCATLGNTEQTASRRTANVSLRSDMVSIQSVKLANACSNEGLSASGRNVSRPTL